MLSEAKHLEGLKDETLSEARGDDEKGLSVARRWQPRGGDPPRGCGVFGRGRLGNEGNTGTGWEP